MEFFWMSLLHCTFLSFLFVSFLYVWKSSLPRDHPITFRNRLIATVCVTFLSILYVDFIAPPSANLGSDSYFLFVRCSTLELIGFRGGLVTNILGGILPLLLTMLLFLGPVSLIMYENDFSLKATAREIVGSADIHRLMTPSFVNLKFLRWTTMHFTAPLLEEIVFRGCVCAILLIGIRHQSQVDNSDKGAHDMVYIAPLFFGMAHMHHVFDHIYSLGMSVRNATLTVLFQLCYTTLFGMLATYYFVRTGLVMAPFLSHVFCNFMGFPDFAAAANKPTNAARIIGAMYLVGLVSFIIALGPLTNPSFFGNSVYY